MNKCTSNLQLTRTNEKIKIDPNDFAGYLSATKEMLRSSHCTDCKKIKNEFILIISTPS